MPGDAVSSAWRRQGISFLAGELVVKAWRQRRCGALGKVELVRRMEALEKVLETGR